jgi:hypothetical protein
MSIVEGLVPQTMVLVEDSRLFRSWILEEESYVIWGVPSKTILRPQSLLFLSAYWLL